MIKEISIKDMKPLRIGQTENANAGTGCTVLICKDGMNAGLDVRGGGPASRETQLLNPLMPEKKIHSVVLGGGSAFGLEAANGVMACLEERNIGYEVGVTRVPLVVQSDLFDLTVGDPFTRPDRNMGYEAAKYALEAPNYQDGNYGAGCGATVGKLCGMTRAMKSGIGSYCIEIGKLQIGAIVAVNALGDIFESRTGKKIAGLMTPGRDALADTLEVMEQTLERSVYDHMMMTNTTIGAVVTNAAFNKSELCKIAGMAHNGYARSIRPVHTSMDGDSIYALSVGEEKAAIDTVGTLAAEVMSRAIERAVLSAESAYGFISAKDL